MEIIPSTEKVHKANLLIDKVDLEHFKDKESELEVVIDENKSL